MELLDEKVVYAGYGVDVEIRRYRRRDGTEVERQVIDGRDPRPRRVRLPESRLHQ